MLHGGGGVQERGTSMMGDKGTEQKKSEGAARFVLLDTTTRYQKWPGRKREEGGTGRGGDPLQCLLSQWQWQ